MLRTALAAALTLSLAAPAFAQSDEGEYWMRVYEEQTRAALAQAKADREAREAKAKAAAAAAAAAVKAAGPCAENKDLEGKGFVFTLKAKSGAKDDLAISFIYSRCTVQDRDTVEDRPATPRAVRVYGGDQAGYELWIETEAGSNKSYLTIVENWAGRGPKNAAWLGEKDNAKLLAGTLDLGEVSVSDTRGDAKSAHAGKAAIQAASFSKPWDDEGPRGCQ